MDHERIYNVHRDALMLDGHRFVVRMEHSQIIRALVMQRVQAVRGGHSEHRRSCRRRGKSRRCGACLQGHRGELLVELLLSLSRGLWQMVWMRGTERGEEAGRSLSRTSWPEYERRWTIHQVRFVRLSARQTVTATRARRR